MVLSPFVVNAAQDTGYAATNTLAGTRLNTPVKDLGSSISIYTKDFLTDIGATNSNDLLVFATGMEAGGPGGNFSGASNDITATQITSQGPRVNPQGSSRTRGLTGPNFTRGFFGTDIAFDAYNTEAVTINRGPNAILFGVGSPAGVVDTTLSQANVNKTATKVEARYGDNDSIRSTLNHNQVIVPGKLAVRVAALYDDEQYDQRPAFETKKRLYGALTFRPYRSTTVRANVETGKTDANRPLSVLPFNSISDAWYAQGRVPFDWTFYDDPARNPSAASQQAQQQYGLLQRQIQFFNQVGIFYGPTGPTSGIQGLIGATSGTAANAVRNATFHPQLNRDLAADTIQWVATVNVAELPAAYWTAANLAALGLSGTQQVGQVPAGTKMQGFVDNSAFDFAHRMLDETGRQGDSFHAANVAIEQLFWKDRIGVELAYDTQRVDSRSLNSFLSANNVNQVRIDTNAFLSNGQANPNLGRPYLNGYGQAASTNNFTERETLRATAFLRYDFKDVNATLGKWLGRHTVTGLYEENAVDSVNYGTRLATVGEAATQTAANIDNFNRRPAVITYVGPSIIGNNNPLQLNPVRGPVLQAGTVVPTTFYRRVANATDPGEIVTVPTTLAEINNGGNASREVIKSQAFVLNSYLLNELLVTTVGWRRDEDFFQRQNIAFTQNPSDLNDPGKAHYGFKDFSFPSTPPPNVADETVSYSAVLKWPHQWLALPQGTDLSVFYNKSENFTPLGGRVDAFNNPLPSPKGKTEEYGFNVEALNGKLNLRLNWFETSVVGAGGNGSVLSAATSNAVVQVASFWAQEVNKEVTIGAPTINTQILQAGIDKLFGALPANYPSLYQYNVTGTPPNVNATFGGLAGRSDTTDFTAKGLEAEIVFNPTPNWRILANVAKQETVQSNSNPVTRAFIERMLPIWTGPVTAGGLTLNMSKLPRGGYPAGSVAGQPLPVNEQTFGQWLDANVLVPFATLQATSGVASAEQRKWRANLVTNYSFGGRDALFGSALKGWSVGGALRWQDKLGLGYPTRRNADGTVEILIDQPYYAPSETNIDLWVGYARKIWNDRINWKVQLNVRNAFGSDDPIAIGVQPWGDIATARIAPERRWYLTNTFEF